MAAGKRSRRTSTITALRAEAFTPATESRTVTVRLGADVFNAMQQLKKETGRPVSTLLREIAVAELRREGYLS